MNELLVSLNGENDVTTLLSYSANSITHLSQFIYRIYLSDLPISRSLDLSIRVNGSADQQQTIFYEVKHENRNLM